MTSDYQKMFDLFGNYWTIVKARRYLGNLEVEIRTSNIYHDIKVLWFKYQDLDRLEYITSATNYLDKDFDPTEYVF